MAAYENVRFADGQKKYAKDNIYEEPWNTEQTLMKIFNGISAHEGTASHPKVPACHKKDGLEKDIGCLSKIPNENTSIQIYQEPYAHLQAKSSDESQKTQPDTANDINVNNNNSLSGKLRKDTDKEKPTDAPPEEEVVDDVLKRNSPEVRQEALTSAQESTTPHEDECSENELDMENSEENYPPKFDVDINLPLAEQRWYHGDILRVEAEKILAHKPTGSFLIRDCGQRPSDLTISIKNDPDITHLKAVQQEDNSYIVGSFSQPFTSAVSMVKYYSEHYMSLKGIGSISLLYPVPRKETLKKKLTRKLIRKKM